MSDDTTAPFLFPAIGRKKVTAAFDGGRITSDGGVMLLAAAEQRLGLADCLARLIADPRNPVLVTHSVADILRARMLAIACGYEDADDLDHLRTDPGFKLACGRLPDSGGDLCSQPTVSRWENAPTLREVVRLSYAMIDTYCASYPRPPKAVTLDIDDTVDVVHGHQQLSLFNAHHDERCFMPIHVYDIATSRPVAMLLRPGKTPSGHEVRSHVRRLVRRIRSHWPTTRLTIRGDGHYGRPEVMAWCEANAVDYIFGLPGNAVLSRLLEEAADDVRVRRAEAQAPVLRHYAEVRYGAKSWGCERRVSARIEASTMGLDIRCVVTNLRSGSAEWLYDTLVWGFWCQDQKVLWRSPSIGRLGNERTEGSLPSGACHSRHNLVIGGPREVRTMMQPCASAAKLRAAGPFCTAAQEPWCRAGHATSDRDRRRSTRRSPKLCVVPLPGV